MDVLTISSAHGGGQAAIVRDDAVLACETIAVAHGLAAALPLAVARLLDGRAQPGLVAAITGPGSFTGLRAGLSVAQGIALGLGVLAVGVTSAEALEQAARPSLNGRAFWTTAVGRTGHVFLDVNGQLGSFPLDDLPPCFGPVAVAGELANLVAATLAARGADVMLTPFRRPAPADLAAVGLARARGALPPMQAVPLYVEPALARPARTARGMPA